MIRTPEALVPYLLLCACVIAGLLWNMSAQLEPKQLAPLGGPFALTDQNGIVRHASDFRGKYVLVYFGYTFCPDVCPTTLANEADALTRLGAKSSGVVPLFITVDPARDTPKALKTYLAAFGPSFVGLTGAPADIATVAHEYRVYYGKRALKGGGYAMDHSGEVYLLGPDGTLLGFYDPPIDGKALAEDLAKHL
ncbi:MAG TPA: SCO family protein [Rhizomicrobium sp.]